MGNIVESTTQESAIKTMSLKEEIAMITGASIFMVIISTILYLMSV